MANARTALAIAEPVIDRAQPVVAEPPRPGASLAIVDVARIARKCVGNALGEDWLLMGSGPRGPRKLAAANQLAQHLVHVIAGRSHHETAKAFSRNRSTATHNFEVLEDLRDAPAWDGFMSLLELQFVHMLVLAETPSPGRVFKAAIEGLGDALDDGTFEGDQVNWAEFMSKTFRDVA